MGDDGGQYYRIQINSQTWCYNYISHNYYLDNLCSLSIPVDAYYWL